MDRHEGVPRPVRQLTQLAFLARLVALVLALVAALGRELTPSVLLGIVIIGGSSFLGLMQTRYLDLVRRHPWIALADALLVASVFVLTGADSPLVLAALTTALLIGLWIERAAGLIAVVALVLLYLVGLSRVVTDESTLFLAVFVVPFIYLVLWLLGVTVRRATDDERRSRVVVSDAVATAAASQERTRVAQELHDSLAKTLQGLTLTAGALPTLIERDPAAAQEATRSIQQMGVTAVAQVREVMTDLRSRTSATPLHQSLNQLAVSWAQDTGRDLRTRIDPVDTDDEAVRYELISIVGEGLDNVRRHAGPCRVDLTLRTEGDQIVVLLVDTGKGAPPDALAAAAAAGHHGVPGMHERMARIGGHLSFRSEPGQGTSVECRVHREGLIER